MLDLNNDLKRCLNGANCCHPDSKDGWLDKSEFYYRKDTNKLRNHCKACLLNNDFVAYHSNPEKKKGYQRERFKTQIQKRLSRIVKVFS